MDNFCGYAEKSRSIRNMALQKNVENILEGHGYQCRSIPSDEHQTIASSGHCTSANEVPGTCFKKRRNGAFSCNRFC